VPARHSWLARRGNDLGSLAKDGEAMKTKKTSRKTSQKQGPPGKPLPRLATAAEEERFCLSWLR
jgi:hypothetical protein